MARFVLIATCAVAFATQLATPAFAQHRSHQPASPSVATPMGSLGAAQGRRLVAIPTSRVAPPREPTVGRPLPGTFAGGFDPYYGRFREVVVLRPAVERIALDITISAVPAIAGIRPAPVGEPVIYRIGGERVRGERQSRHRDSRHHRRDASVGSVRVVHVGR